MKSSTNRVLDLHFHVHHASSRESDWSEDFSLLVSNSNGLRTTSDGLQPTSTGLQPNRDRLQLQPSSRTLR